MRMQKLLAVTLSLALIIGTNVPASAIAEEIEDIHQKSTAVETPVIPAAAAADESSISETPDGGVADASTTLVTTAATEAAPEAEDKAAEPSTPQLTEGGADRSNPASATDEAGDTDTTATPEDDLSGAGSTSLTDAGEPDSSPAESLVSDTESDTISSDSASVPSEDAQLLPPASSKEPEAFVQEEPEPVIQDEAESIDATPDNTALPEPDEPAASPVEPVSMPAFSAEEVVDDVVISVNAPEGVFPAGAALEVTRAEAEAEPVDADDATIVEEYAFDITIRDAEGNVLEPADNTLVTVSFTHALVADANLQTDVFHVVDNQPVALDVKTTDNMAEIVTDSFSTFIVRFIYNDMQYVLDGNATADLTDILAAVGLTGEVEAASVSNDELVGVTQTDGTWTVCALAPFDTEEALSVTIAGVTYAITLLDDSESGGSGSHTSDGKGNHQIAGVKWIYTDYSGTNNQNTVAIAQGKTVDTLTSQVISYIESYSSDGRQYYVENLSGTSADIPMRSQVRDAVSQAFNQCYANHKSGSSGADSSDATFNPRVVAVGFVYGHYNDSTYYNLFDTASVNRLTWESAWVEETRTDVSKYGNGYYVSNAGVPSGTPKTYTHGSSYTPTGSFVNSAGTSTTTEQLALTQIGSGVNSSGSYTGSVWTNLTTTFVVVMLNNNEPYSPPAAKVAVQKVSASPALSSGSSYSLSGAVYGVRASVSNDPGTQYASACNLTIAPAQSAHTSYTL